MCLLALYVFEEVSVQIFGPFFDEIVFFFLILSYMDYLYILEINPLSVTLFANIFSQSVDCLFILCMVSFAVQKLVSLIRSHLFIFALFLLPWETDQRK